MLKAPAAPRLILASSSRYRGELLARLQLPYTALAPDIDESPQAHETAGSLASRLALTKARKLATLDPGSWVLGSDQAAECDGRILGKPGGASQARDQLQWCAGKTVHFHTAVALVGGGAEQQALDLTKVRFRTLTLREIERYLALEPAYDCAGSFKCEGLGISLFEAIETSDPTALVGLPLILTARLLRQAGWALP